MKAGGRGEKAVDATFKDGCAAPAAFLHAAPADRTADPSIPAHRR